MIQYIQSWLFGWIRWESAYVGSALFFHVFSIFWPCHALPGRSNSGSELWELIQLCEMNEAQLFHHSAWQTFNPDPVHPVNPCHSSAMAVVAVDVTAKHWDNMAAGKKKHIISLTSVKCAKTCCMHNQAGMSLTPHSLVCLLRFLSAGPPLSRSVVQLPSKLEMDRNGITVVVCFTRITPLRLNSSIGASSLPKAVGQGRTLATREALAAFFKAATNLPWQNLADAGARTNRRPPG